MLCFDLGMILFDLIWHDNNSYCKASSFLALSSHGLKLMNIKLSEKLNCGFGGKSKLYSDF